VKRILRSFIVTIISYVLIFLPVVNAADALSLPAGDLIAPVIKHSPITSKIPPGEIATIQATVTDNVAVKNVTVFYRDIGAANFNRTKMVRESGTDYYSTTLPEVMEPGVEYYIQATDRAGNTILHGHTFAPLTIAVSADAPLQEETEAVTIAAQEEKAAAKPDKGISKWVWIGLGVLAVGALAGGGGDDDPGTAGKTDPTTGTVNISGRTP